MKSNFLLVSGGRVHEELLKSTISSLNNPFIIGIDGGMNILDKLNIMPDIIIGDFDSATEMVREKYMSLDRAIVLNPIKDYTDTHMAVLKAIELGAKSITMLGATGTRLDHVVGNFALLKLCLDEGIKAVILDENNRITMIDKHMSLKKTEQYGRYVSCIPFSDEVTGINLRGFVYELTDATMIKAETIGVSNEIREEEGHISINTGYLMVMETKD